MSLMLDGNSFETVLLANRVKLIAVLFMHPNSEVAEKIVPMLDRFNLASGANTDFFFAGYGAYWPPLQYSDQQKVTSVGGVDWYFSERAFQNFTQEFQSRTAWRYSGATDFILTTARWSREHSTAELDFRECVATSIDKLLRDKAIESVPEFFQKIFYYGETTGNPSAFSFSDKHLIACAKAGILDWVLERLGTKKFYDKNRELATKDISKRD